MGRGPSNLRAGSFGRPTYFGRPSGFADFCLGDVLEQQLRTSVGFRTYDVSSAGGLLYRYVVVARCRTYELGQTSDVPNPVHLRLLHRVSVVPISTTSLNRFL